MPLGERASGFVLLFDSTIHGGEPLPVLVLRFCVFGFDFICCVGVDDGDGVVVGRVRGTMAGNEWINGYLEAILDSGAAAIDEQKAAAVAVRERGAHFNPTQYFVEEVVSGVDEADLHRTWIKVVATRNARERSNRLENMCWRIWHLARRKKQVYFYRIYLSINLPTTYIP